MINMDINIKEINIDYQQKLYNPTYLFIKESQTSTLTNSNKQ